MSDQTDPQAEGLAAQLEPAMRRRAADMMLRIRAEFVEDAIGYDAEQIVGQIAAFLGKAGWPISPETEGDIADRAAAYAVDELRRLRRAAGSQPSGNA
ncbi:hypothetical protein [Inquilinus sp.]|uniref:hypothetical protein n=1 Tax=Inquilinus sp. TaxID=1932117 RepID=UPI003783AC42